MAESAKLRLSDRVAERVRRDLAAREGTTLPPMRAMAAAYGVSLGAMLAAARRLRREGVIEFGHGRRARKALAEAPMPAPCPSPLERCVAAIGERVRSGALPAATPVGKTAALATEFRVSRTTISQALAELSRRGLTHKDGKYWLAGPRPGPRNLALRAEPPVIVLVQDHPRGWDSFAIAARTARFCVRFSTEVERYGVQIAPAFTMRERAPFAAPAFDLPSTVAYVKSLGRRCLGVLFAATHHNTPEFHTWLEALTSTAAKVAWWDRTDRGLRSPLPRRTFCRCRFSEDAALREALEYLYGLGHRRVLYTTEGRRDTDTDWVTRRYLALERIGRELGIHLDVCPPSRSAAESGTTGAGAFGIDARWIDALSAGLEQYQPTALLAPRDVAATRQYQQLRWLGLRIPEDVSLLSFDNYPMIQSAPISAVDFGMGHLGYCAFHWLFGVIGMRREANGDIPTRPQIADRGSCAPPRDGTRRLTLRRRPGANAV